MRKTFISNLILLLSLNLLVKPVYLLFVEAEIQNRAGADHFGNYFALINFSFLLNILLDMGITNWNTRNISRHEHSLTRFLPVVLPLRLILAFVYILIILVAGLVLKYSADQLFILFILAFNQVLASLILYLRSNLTGLHLFVQDSIISILDRFTLLLMMAFLLWGGITEGGNFEIIWLVWGQTISYVVTALVAMVMVLRRSGKIRLTFNIAESSQVLKESLPFAMLILFSTIAYRTDSVMLERLHPDGATQAGIYAMGFRFYEAFNMIAYLFAVLLLPIFSRMLHVKQEISTITALAFKILFVLAWILTVVCMFFGNQILSLFYDHLIPEATPVFRLLMMACLGFSLQYVFGTLLTANASFRILITIAIFAMVVNIGLNLLWIPGYGALGSAAANCITQVSVLIAQMVMVYRSLKIRPGRMVIPGLLAFSGGTAIIAWACTINDLHFALSIVTITIGGLLLAVLTRMLDLRQFLRTIRQTG